MCQAPRVLTWVRLSLWLWKNSPAARKDEELLPALETGKPSCGCPAGEVTGDVHKGRKRVNRTVQYHPVAERSEVELRGSILMDRASLVVQWLRIHLPMQETWVQALLQEDPTCCRATKPVRHNC